MSPTLIVGLINLAIILLLFIFLPAIFNKLGYHPTYSRRQYNMPGKKALIITTSSDKMDYTGRATGVFGSELSVPYYEFADAGLEVDLASIKGGIIPIQPTSIKYPLAHGDDKRFMGDSKAQAKRNNSFKIDDLDFKDYDLIFMAGGWGAAYDLGYSEVLGQKISQARQEDKIMGGVCHGLLGFRLAREVDGKPLVEGKNITAVTDKQIRQLGIRNTPLHPEAELRKLKANFKSKTAFVDMVANLVVRDGNIVSGQNQNSAGEVAQEMLALLAKKQEESK